MGTALVTGGSRGIGRGAAAALARAGFDVAIADIVDPSDATAALDDVRAAGRQAAYWTHDVTDIGAHVGFVREVESRLGPLQCLVNNAGVTSLVRGDMLALTPESFDRSVDINLRGTFFLTQAVANAMIAADPGGADRYRSIFVISSVNAEIVGVNRADYCITKAGLAMVAKLFAARLGAHGIHVFDIRPGITRTDMTKPATAIYDRYIADGGVPLPRWGRPEDVGQVIATIAQGLLPYATGEAIHVGGGIHLHRV